MTTIEVSAETVELGVAYGLMRVVEDGVAELTPKGEKVLRARAERVIREAEDGAS